MPLKANPPPDFIGLALDINARRHQAMKDMQAMMLQRVKAQQDAAESMERRRGMELDNAQKALAMRQEFDAKAAELAPLADIANAVPPEAMDLPVDQRAAALSTQQAAANQFVTGLERNIGARALTGQSPQQAGIEAGQAANPEVVSAQSAVAEGVKRRESDRVAQRDFDFQQKAARNAEARTARRAGRKVLTLTDQIFDAEDRLGALQPGTREHARQKARLNNLNSEMIRQVNEGIPGEVVESKRFMAQEVASLQQIDRAVADLEEIDSWIANQGDGFLGSIRGGGAELLASVPETVADLSELLGGRDLGDTILRDSGNLSRSQASKLQKQLGVSEDGTLQRVSDARILSARIAYIITRNQNPGRFSNQQYEDTLERIRFDKGTSAAARRRLKTATAELRASSRNVRERVMLYNQALGVDTSGALIDSRSGAQVISPPTSTGFSGFGEAGGGVQGSAPDQNGIGEFLELPEPERRKRLRELLKEQGL